MKNNYLTLNSENQAPDSNYTTVQLSSNWGDWDRGISFFKSLLIILVAIILCLTLYQGRYYARITQPLDLSGEKLFLTCANADGSFVVPNCTGGLLDNNFLKFNLTTNLTILCFDVYLCSLTINNLSSSTLFLDGSAPIKKAYFVKAQVYKRQSHSPFGKINAENLENAILLSQSLQIDQDYTAFTIQDLTLFQSIEESYGGELISSIVLFSLEIAIAVGLLCFCIYEWRYKVTQLRIRITQDEQLRFLTLTPITRNGTEGTFARVPLDASIE